MSADKPLLDQFWKLISANENQRIQAAFKIVSHLQHKERKEKLEENGTNLTTSSMNSAVLYCLKRCIQGLASSKESSRHGFFICLTEVLRLYEGSRCTTGSVIDELLQMIDEFLNIGNTSKGEEGEYLLGKCLSIGAIIKSGLTNGKTTEVCTVMERLVKLGSQRSYLRIIAYKYIIEYVTDGISISTFRTLVWPTISKACKWNGDDGGNIESLWLFLEIVETFPSILQDKAIVMETCGRKQLVTEEFTKEASTLVMGGSMSAKSLRQCSVLCKLVKCLMIKPDMLRYFWQNHIDKVPASSFKTVVKFALLDLIIVNTNDINSISQFLTKNVVDTIMDVLSRIESTTEEEAIILMVLEHIIAASKENTELQRPVLKLLLQNPGKITFDQLTGHGTVQKLTSVAEPKTVKMLAKLYQDALCGNSDVNCSKPTAKLSASATNARIYAAHQLAKLVGHPVMQEEIKWKIEVLSAILSLTLFEMKQPYGPIKTTPMPLSSEAKKETKEIFFRALDVKAKGFEAMCTILTSTLEYTDKLLKEKDIARPLYSFDESSDKAWKKIVKTVQKLGATESKKESKVFQLLFTHMGFQLFSDPLGAQDIINDLYICLDESEKAYTSKQVDDDEPKWVEVIVDSLLSLMSQNKNVLRQVVNSVMALLCPHMTVNALQAVIDVINPQEDKENDPHSEDENMSGEDENMSGEDEISDTEDAPVDENEEDSSDESEDEDAGNVDDAFKERIKQALGEAKAESGDEDDNASIDMDDLDDEAMNKMDEALGQLFKQLSGKKNPSQVKKEKKDATAQMHFKIRCLDIIDVYLNHEPKMSHVLFLLSPLLESIETYMKKKDDEPLAIRLKNTVKKITGLKKIEEADKELEPSSLVEMLQSLIDLANTASPLVSELSQPLPIYAQCCTLVLKFSQKIKNEELDENILSIYKKAMNSFFNKAHCQLPITVFLLPMKINWVGSWSLIEDLIKCGFSSTTRLFRRSQAFTLLNAFLRNQSLQDLAKKDLKIKVFSTLGDKLIEEFNQYLAGSNDTKPKILCELLNVTHGLYLAGASENLPQWKDIVAILESLRSHIPKNRHFHDVKKAYNKACAPLKIKVIQGCEKRESNRNDSVSSNNGTTKATNGFFDDMMENGTEAKDGEEKIKKSKKKKKKSKEDLQKKKERKIHSVEGQFEGMAMPDFSGVGLNDNLNFESTVQSTKKEKSHKNPKVKKVSKSHS